MQIPLSSRPRDGHKGTFGRVLIIAGSPGMSGAASLAGTAALRSGAGLVTVAVPQSIQSIVASFEPSFTTVGLPCRNDGQLSGETIDVVSQLLTGRDAVGVGPGLGQSEVVGSVIRALIERADVPLILDADALNAVASGSLSLRRAAPTVMTPHPGEFARLTGRSAGEVETQRESLAVEYARRQGVVVVLKGAGTVVTDGTQTYVNTTGNSGMATGGTGDVLTGVITALSGQGMTSYDASVAAVFVHGRAGDLAAGETSERGLIASDLLKWLPHAWAAPELE